MVFAHFMLANQNDVAEDADSELGIASYQRQVRQAQTIGIDGFALNAGGWLKEPRYIKRSAEMFDAPTDCTPLSSYSSPPTPVAPTTPRTWRICAGVPFHQRSPSSCEHTFSGRRSPAATPRRMRRRPSAQQWNAPPNAPRWQSRRRIHGDEDTETKTRKPTQAARP
jgi:hypothetical protein